MIDVHCSVLVLRHEYSFHDALKETKDHDSYLRPSCQVMPTQVLLMQWDVHMGWCSPEQLLVTWKVLCTNILEYSYNLNK